MLYKAILIILSLWFIFIAYSMLPSSDKPREVIKCPKERKTIGSYAGAFPIFSALDTQFCDKFLRTKDLSEYKKIGLLPYSEEPRCKEVVIMDALELGYFPTMEYGGVKIEGGVPQNADLARHREKLKQDLVERIPDMDYNGIAAIGNLPWHPIWDLNTGPRAVYVTETLKTPAPSDRRGNSSFHRSLFEDAASTFLVDTLQQAKALRPQAFWCYLGLPSCYEGECKNSVNDRLRELWHKYDIFCPLINFGAYGMPSNDTVLEILVRELFAEVLDIELHHVPHQVYAFIFLHYKDGRLLSDGDLLRVMAQAACMGVSGVVITGDSSHLTYKQGCYRLSELFDYIVSDISTLRDNLVRCAAAFCEQRGSCRVQNYYKMYYPKIPFYPDDVDGCYDFPPARKVDPKLSFLKNN